MCTINIKIEMFILIYSVVYWMKEWKCIHINWQLQTFDDGQYIIRQGDIGEKFYVIFKGKVTVSMTDDNGNAKFLIELGEGEVFGEQILSCPF